MTWPTASAAAAALTALALAACEGAPAEPTWAADVAPILRASCVRCHALPVLDGAPERLRFDRADPDDGELEADVGAHPHGARVMAVFIAARAGDRSMPPRYPLSARQIEVLQNWAPDPGSGELPLLGDPAPGNRAPTMAMLAEPDLADDGAISWRYELDDPDGDLVTGSLRYRGAAEGVITHELTSGRGEVRWDVAALPAGDYELYALLDDASGVAEVEVGSYARVAGGHAPTIALDPDGRLRPLLTDVVPPVREPFAIELALGDLDGDDLTLTVEVARGGETIAIVEDQAATAGELTIEFPQTELPAGQGWRLIATVSDGEFTRTARSPDFAIGHGTTELRFADVAPIFERNCSGCHAGLSSTIKIPRFPLELSGDDYEGVARQYAFVYRRVVQQQNMPPVSAEVLLDQAPMPDADREALREWLLAGAPE